MSSKSSVEIILTWFREKLNEALARVGSPTDLAKDLALIDAYLKENGDFLRAASADMLGPHAELLSTIIRDLDHLQRQTGARLDWFKAMNVSLAEKISDKS